MSVIALAGLMLLALVALVVLAIIVWLIARPAPTTRGSAGATPERSAPPAPEPLQPGRDMAEARGGPHPRPRELDREARRELRLLDEQLHSAFFDRSRMSPDEWARVADRLLIVHDRIPVGILLERFERATDTCVSAPPATEMSAREIIATLNAQLGEERRLELLGRLGEPLEADVYAPAPQSAGTSAR